MATKPTEKAKKTTTTVKKAKAAKKPVDNTVRLATSGKGTLSKRATKHAAKPPCRAGKCKRAYRAKGYCAHHYALWRSNEYGNGRYKQCSDTSCSKPKATNRFGYCEDHYTNYYVKGQAVAKVAHAAAPAKEEKKKEAAA